MKKSRGGQKTHWAEKVRVWVWYLSIKALCDWSDYALDHEFAWTEQGKLSRDVSDRPRTFEWIRKTARKPRGLDKRWHSMEGLVAEVNKHPLFKGTQALYEAQLWDLLQRDMLKPDTIRIRITQILEENNLVWLDPDEHLTIDSLSIKHGLSYIYDRCLMLSLRKMDTLPGIALVWMLYVLNEPVHNWHLRSVLESIADKQLDDFFRYFFPIVEQMNYYTDAIETLQRNRLDMSESTTVGYGYIETIGAWPILPKELLGSISEEMLFPMYPESLKLIELQKLEIALD